MPDPLVLAADVETELVERRSRFLTRLHRVESLEQADAFLRTARADHPDARHRCTALVIGERESSPPVHRSSDDGEPSGTAGMPMLQALLHAGLTDTLAIVIRYFGGVKLGAGGLLRAYTAGVEQAVAASTLLRRRELRQMRLDVPFAEAGIAENAVRRFAEGREATTLPTEYGARHAALSLLIDPALEQELAADIAAWSQGRLSPERVGSRTVDLPLP
ncbi:IMPACT family protein [Brachybacterium hainanense]|uniref:IMPACT family protein n=1 Tax=Brachybacterium hainanense TaxID=1541174 RepID=A0ABV6RBT2_9MICO